MAFAVFAMFSNPDIYQRVRREAEALFSDGDPGPEDFREETIDNAHRLVLETLRLYPSVPLQLRTVMNNCIVEGFELPVGARVLLASTAVHYLEENYPDPLTFDIDRYLPGARRTRNTGLMGHSVSGRIPALAQEWWNIKWRSTF